MSRKLDAAIAVALGYEVRGSEMGCIRYAEDRPVEWVAEPLPHFCGGGDDMLRLDALMRARGWLLGFWWGTPKTCCAGYKRQDDDREYQATATALPEAVALAAYRALTGEEWEEESTNG